MNKIIDIYLKGVVYILIRYVFRKKYIKANCRFIESSFKCYTVDGIGRHLFKYGIHEQQNSLYLKKNLSLRENEIAIDIGSNLGWYSVLISRIASPKSIIHSFEADVANFELLQHNLVSNNCLNVKPHNVAISDSAGKTEFYKYPLKNAGRHSLIPQEGFEKISVNTTTLDKLLIDADKSKVKFIKIDIEGYEYFAFRGA